MRTKTAVVLLMTLGSLWALPPLGLQEWPKHCLTAMGDIELFRRDAPVRKVELVSNEKELAAYLHRQISQSGRNFGFVTAMVFETSAGKPVMIISDYLGAGHRPMIQQAAKFYGPLKKILWMGEFKATDNKSLHISTFNESASTTIQLAIYRKHGILPENFEFENKVAHAQAFMKSHAPGLIDSSTRFMIFNPMAPMISTNQIREKDGLRHRFPNSASSLIHTLAPYVPLDDKIMAELRTIISKGMPFVIDEYKRIITGRPISHDPTHPMFFYAEIKEFLADIKSLNARKFAEKYPQAKRTELASKIGKLSREIDDAESAEFVIFDPEQSDTGK